MYFTCVYLLFLNLFPPAVSISLYGPVNLGESLVLFPTGT